MRPMHMNLAILASLGVICGPALALVAQTSRQGLTGLLERIGGGMDVKLLDRRNRTAVHAFPEASISSQADIDRAARRDAASTARDREIAEYTRRVIAAGAFLLLPGDRLLSATLAPPL